MPIEHSGLPPKYHEASIKNVCQEQKKENIDILKNWIFNCKKPIFLHGNPGRGKTYTAAACMHFLHRNAKLPYHEMKFINISDLNQNWIAWEVQKRLEELKKMQEVSLLILDDIGVKSPTDAFLDYLYAVVNHRETYQKISIFITNLNSKELNESFGPRLVSRFTCGDKIKFEGDDLRLKYD